MLNEKMQKALNKQINAELYSAYLYLSMQAYFKSLNLPGFANWMHVQVREELIHAMKIYDFVNERNGRVTLKEIAEPPAQWQSPLAAFEEVSKHEQKVTALINDLVNLAIEEKDHATNIFLQWFVNEQVEEEASAEAVVQELKLVKDAPDSLLLLDRQLAQRVFEAPAGTTEK
ncbi:MAG: ferritin [Planctomycetota bacterium]|jgi:ferritin